MTTKQLVNEVLDTLPETATIDDVMYALYVRAKIEKSEQAIEAGHTLSHEQVVKRMGRCLG